MRYSKTLNLIATSIIASSILVGCSSSSNNNTTNSGVAIDPELQGATVFLDINKNGVRDANEQSTTTSDTGAYSLVMDKSEVGAPIVVVGGIDRVTRENFTGKLSVISQAGNANLHITPLTTLVHQYKKKNPNLDVDAIKIKLAAQLNINADDFDANIVAQGKEKLLKIALLVQKMAQGITDANSTTVNIEDIYADIATKLADANLTTALNDVCDAKINSSDFENKKLKDMENELDRFDIGVLTPVQLALSMDKIDNNISAATTPAQLDLNISNDSNFRINTDIKVKEQRNERTFKALGLADLNATQKDAIYAKFSTTNINFEDASLKDIIKRMLDADMAGELSAAQKSMFENMSTNFEKDHDGMKDSVNSDMNKMYDYHDYENNSTTTNH